MENLTSAIICLADNSVGVMKISNMPSSTSFDNSSNKLSHDTTTETGQRSKSNSPDVTDRSFLNTMFSSMQSWQSGQSVNTWMPQTL